MPLRGFRAGQLWRIAKRTASLVRMQLAGGVGLAPKLPPGSLGVAGVARFGDEGFYLRRFRRYGPIFKVLWNQNLAICVVGFQRARRLLAIHAQALSPVHVDISAFVPNGFLRTMVPEHHPHYRALFLSAQRIESSAVWETELRTVMHTELSALANAQHAAPPLLVLVLDRITLRALLVLFFGLLPTDREFAALEAGFLKLGPTGFVYPIGSVQRDAFAELRTIVWRVVAALKATPPSGRAQGQLARLLALDDGGAVDETVVGNLIYMIEIGRYDMRSLLRWVLKVLSDHPTVVADLDAKRQAADSFADLAEGCVLETLRLDQAEAMNREVREEFVFDGYRFPQGSSVRMLMRESHKDPEVFPEPEQFKPCRFAGKTFSADAYAPFGVGEHRCIVGPLVVRVCALVVEELTTGFTWSVVADGPRFRGRHHWEPSPDFAIALRPRSRTEGHG